MIIDPTEGLDVLALALGAPFQAVDPEDFTTIHGVTMHGIIAGAFEDEGLLAACGHPVKLLPGAEPDSALIWPPYVADLPDGYRRCLACHKATGRKRPRRADR